MSETPSQKKYRKKCPTIAFRCKSEEERDQIREFARLTGKSLSNYLRDQMKDGKKNYNDGFKKGCEITEKEVDKKHYDKGYFDGLKYMEKKYNKCKKEEKELQDKLAELAS